MFEKILKIWAGCFRSELDLPDLPIQDQSSLGSRRVMLALEMIKTKKRALELSDRANKGFIDNFRLKLRATAQAHKLCAMRKDLPLWQRAMYYNGWIVNMAACLLFVFIARINVANLGKNSVDFSENKVYGIYSKQCNGDSELLDMLGEMRCDDGRGKA